MLSRFNVGCDCDCCIVYRSEFCKNWYESVFERKYFGSTDGNPSAMNLNGGSFDQVGVFTEEDTKIWKIRNDACSSDLSSCDTSTDSKGWTYSQNHYLTPTGNLASSYLSTLLVASKFQWWLYTFWDTCDSTDGAHCWDSSTNAPVRNQKMLFAFDYKDQDNWVGIEVEYKPDFDVTPGAVENVFEIRGRQNVSGTATYITNAFTVNLGTGSTKKEVGIEINVDQRTECGSNKFVFIDFAGSDINFEFVSVDGDKCALTQLTPSGVVDTLNCDGTDYTIGVGFGIYNWVHQYLDSEQSGCASYTVGCGCDCYVPDEYEVTITGVANNDDCSTCTNLNDTFTLTKVDESESKATFDPCTVSGCLWAYEASGYTPITCDVGRIELFRCGDDWKLLFLYDTGFGFYETIGYFILADQDCIVEDLNLGSNTNGCWFTTEGFSCPSNLCNVSSISVEISSS